MIKAVFIMPHPPLMVPGIGDAGKITKTTNSVGQIADEIFNIRPETIILISPHAPAFQDFIHITNKERLIGSFKDFGRGDIRYDYKNNTKLVSKIIQEAKGKLPVGSIKQNDLKTYRLDDSLDHGCMVPLHYVSEKYKEFSIVRIPIAGFSYENLYKMGKCIKDAVNDMDINAVVISSADLSHKLNVDGPYGFAKEGPEFDRKVKEYIETNDIKSLMTMDENFERKAAMCGLPSIVMGYGSLLGSSVESEVLSYEGPYGVGYLTARIIVKSEGISS